MKQVFRQKDTALQQLLREVRFVRNLVLFLMNRVEFLHNQCNY